MAETAVEVGDDADGEGAERVCDLRVGGEAAGGEVVDDVARKGDEEHNGDLLGAAVVDDDEAEGEGGHEDEGPPGGHAGLAGGVVGGGLVDGAEDGGADGDAEAEEEAVDDGVDHADGAGEDVAGLQLEGAAEDDVAWEDHGDGGLGQGGETEYAAALDGTEGSSEEAG